MFQRQAIALIDETGREVRGETAFLLPGIVEQARELIQVAPFKARLHIYGYLLDMVQRLQHRVITVLGRFALVFEDRS